MSAGPTKSDWPPDRIERLRSLAAAGLGPRQIADKLGLSRNSILGKCYRLGIALTRQGKAKRQPSRKRNISLYDGWKPPRQSAADGLPVVVPSTATLQPPQPISLSVDTPEAPTGIYDLQPGQCRFICSGEGVDSIYCGAASVGGCSWCVRHRAVVWRPRAA